MKKIIICTIALSILFVLAACVSHPVHVHYPTEESQDSESQVIELQDSEPQDSGSQDSEAQDNSPQNSAPSLPGKIAIITQESFTQSAHHSSNWVIALTEEHGPENVIIYTWPTHNHNVTATETEDMITKIAQNTEIGVLIIDPATYGTDHIVNILRQQRNDIFIAYIGYYTTTNPNANLILSIDTEEMTRRFPSNAMELGADTLIFFYDTMTWDDEVYVESYIHGMMREKSAEIGLAFVEVDIAGAIQCGSSFAMFMTETIPPLLEEHGTNIVLYGLDNERVFWDWRNNGFIYLPMYPSWYQLYPINLAVELSILDSRAPNIGIYDTPQLIEEIKKDLEERGLSGRIAASPISQRMLLPLAAAEYGVRWMHGEVPYQGIDTQVLHQIMFDLITQRTGLYHNITLTQFEENGMHDNYILVLVDFLVY